MAVAIEEWRLAQSDPSLKHHEEIVADLSLLARRIVAGTRNRWLHRHPVTVVIPALNEAENLPHVLPRIPHWVDEVILVDGESTDGTCEVARRLWPTIRVVTQQAPGKGAALRTGFAAATGDIIVMLDADGSTDPGEIPAFVGALLGGADFAKGTRFVQGGGSADISLGRSIGNRIFTVLCRMLFSNRYSDLCYGYNAFWKRILPQLRLDCDGFEIETLLNLRVLGAGLRITEVPSFEAARLHGRSRLRTIPDGWRVLKTIFKEAIRSPRLPQLVPDPVGALAGELPALAFEEKLG